MTVGDNDGETVGVSEDSSCVGTSTGVGVTVGDNDGETVGVSVDISCVGTSTGVIEGAWDNAVLRRLEW